MELDTALETKLGEELQAQRLKKIHRSKNAFLLCENGLGIEYDANVVTYEELDFPEKKFGPANKVMKFAVLKGTPKNGEPPFAKIIYHGSSEGDAQRTLEQQHLAEINAILYKMGFEVENLGDPNASFAKPKDPKTKILQGLRHSAFEVDLDELRKAARNVLGLKTEKDIPKEFILEAVRLATGIALKGRVFGNPHQNHQGGKGIKKGAPLEVDYKPMAISTKKRPANMTDEQAIQSTETVLQEVVKQGIPNPETEVYTLGQPGHCPNGSDHQPLKNPEAEAEYVDPKNMGLYALMGSAGKTGCAPPLLVYRHLVTPEEAGLQEQSGDLQLKAIKAALFELNPKIADELFEINKKPQEFKKVSELDYAEFSRFIQDKGNTKASDLLLKESGRATLKKHLWETWVNTECYRDVNALLITPSPCTQADLNAAVDKIRKDIITSLSEDFIKSGQTAAGYPALPEDPRLQQLRTLFYANDHAYALTETEEMTPEEEALESVKIRGHLNVERDMRDLSEARDLRSYLKYLESQGVKEAEYNEDKEYQESFSMRITLEKLRKKVRDVYVHNYVDTVLPVDAPFDNEGINVMFKQLAKLALSEENVDIACALVEHERIKPWALEEIASRFISKNQRLTRADLAVIAGIPEIQAKIEALIINNIKTQRALSANDLSVIADVPAIAKKVVTTIMTGPDTLGNMESVVSDLMQIKKVQRLFAKDLIIRAWLTAKAKQEPILTEKDLALINKFTGIREKLAFKFSEIEEVAVRAALLNQPKMYKLLAEELIARAPEKPTPVDKEILEHKSCAGFPALISMANAFKAATAAEAAEKAKKGKPKASGLEVKEGKESAEQAKTVTPPIADALEAVLREFELPITSSLAPERLSPTGQGQGQEMLSQFQSERVPADKVPEGVLEEAIAGAVVSAAATGGRKRSQSPSKDK